MVEMVTKAAVGLSGFLGGLVAPVTTQFLDQPAADSAVEAGTIAIPEMQPLWSRWGIMLPFLTGIPTLLLGLFGDKILEKRPNLQLGLLNYGVTATVGGGVELGRAMGARTAQGMSSFSPTEDQALAAVADFCPVRGIAYYAVPKDKAKVPACGDLVLGAGAGAAAAGAGASARARRRSRSVVA